MSNGRCRLLFVLLLLALIAQLSTAGSAQQMPVREVTILYTNDFHSAFDPIPAYWLKGSPRIGGAAYLAAYINQIRKREPTSFLFDTGDMFTGQLSFLTRGEAKKIDTSIKRVNDFGRFERITRDNIKITFLD
jgi:2',3'-cyclic-nucleotide 2'-phosphodiesterase (5'-nucleotidase family)